MTNDAFQPLKVYGWAADYFGCGYYRIGVPLQGLQERGHLIYASMYLEAHAEMADVIIGQRIANPGPSATWQILAKAGKKLIYEVDDDLLNIDPTSVEAFKFFNEPEVRANVIRNIEVSDLVTVTTEPLAEVIRKINPNVRVIPNFIDEAMFDIEVPRNERMTIGWGGSTTHYMDFQEAGRMLKKVAERVPEVDFQFSGADYGAKYIPKNRYRFVPWSLDIFRHYNTAARADIGIAPLKRHRFNDSKSHIKALEYNALGIPVVASSVTPYRNYIEHGENGFLIAQDYDWIKYLTKLARDPELYAHMVEVGKAKAREHTIQRNAHLWEDAVREVMAIPRSADQLFPPLQAMRMAG